MVVTVDDSHADAIVALRAVYLALPNAEEIKKKFKITTILCIRADKTGT